VAVARAAAARGTAVGLSSFGSKPMEEVAAANPQFAFQMYWINDRDWIAGQMERARAAGAKAVILTLDWSFSHSRDWGSPPLPERIDLRTMVKYAPAVIVRPTWLLRYLRSGTLPDLSTPNMTVDGGPAPTFFGAYGQWMGTPQPTWDDLAWFAGQWGGPCLLKGVMRVDDARRARDAGFSAISVSNHGGNNLDGTPSPLRALPAIAAAVGSDIEVLLDGGVRRGADVVKAVALGARAVMIGRAYLWGLAANGQAGVENVLDILRMGIDSSLLGMGVASIHDVRREHLLVPDGFERPLGAG
jgi:heme/flavin dehydrogenase (mycofactocin system)